MSRSPASSSSVRSPAAPRAYCSSRSRTRPASPTASCGPTGSRRSAARSCRRRWSGMKGRLQKEGDRDPHHHRQGRQISGIDQGVGLNRALWTLAMGCSGSRRAERLGPPSRVAPKIAGGLDGRARFEPQWRKPRHSHASDPADPAMKSTRAFPFRRVRPTTSGKTQPGTDFEKTRLGWYAPAYLAGCS